MKVQKKKSAAKKVSKSSTKKPCGCPGNLVPGVHNAKVCTARKKKPAPKPKVYATVKEEWYRVDTEIPSVDRKTGLTSYTYTNSPPPMDEQAARRVMEGMKLIGVGGRLIHLDGTPDGKLVATWGNVERMAQAEKQERAAKEATAVPARQN